MYIFFILITLITSGCTIASSSSSKSVGSGARPKGDDARKEINEAALTSLRRIENLEKEIAQLTQEITTRSNPVVASPETGGLGAELNEQKTVAQLTQDLALKKRQLDALKKIAGAHAKHSTQSFEVNNETGFALAAKAFSGNAQLLAAKRASESSLARAEQDATDITLNPTFNAILGALNESDTLKAQIKLEALMTGITTGKGATILLPFLNNIRNTIETTKKSIDANTKQIEELKQQISTSGFAYASPESALKAKQDALVKLNAKMNNLQRCQRTLLHYYFNTRTAEITQHITNIDAECAALVISQARREELVNEKTTLTNELTRIREQQAESIKNSPSAKS